MFDKQILEGRRAQPAAYCDAASMLIDQLKEIYIGAELELVETENWLPKLIRSDFVLASCRKVWRVPASTPPTRPSMRITAAVERAGALQTE